MSTTISPSRPRLFQAVLNTLTTFNIAKEGDFFT